jgi:hypothetical protein
LLSNCPKIKKREIAEKVFINYPKSLGKNFSLSICVAQHLTLEQQMKFVDNNMKLPVKAMLESALDDNASGG